MIINSGSHMGRKGSTNSGNRRRNKIAGQFSVRLAEMLWSPAWRVLSLSAHRVIDRVSLELRNHGGHGADGLAVTYNDYEQYGIDRHSIAPAIREAVALGFLTIVRQGRAGNADFRQSTLYLPTFEVAIDFEPTHEWHKITDFKTAREIAAEARTPRRQSGKRKDRKNKKPMGDSQPTPVAGSPIESDQSPVMESPITSGGKIPHYF